LMLIPYPPTTVDMGQYLQRAKEPRDIAHGWVDYVSELEKEAESDPNRDATIVAIGVHPFVFGTPDGALALRRVLQALKKHPLVWLADTDAVMDASTNSGK
jgi:allantoinase